MGQGRPGDHLTHHARTRLTRTRRAGDPGAYAGGMRIVIAGGHGKIALLLERLLAERGDQAVGLIRNPAHVADVQKAGAEAVVRDLESASVDDVAAALSGADAVVFAAGAG